MLRLVRVGRSQRGLRLDAHRPERVPTRLRTPVSKLIVMSVNRCRLALGLLLPIIACGDANLCAQSPASQHAFFHVSLDRSFTSPASGRLLLFIAPVSTGQKPSDSVDMQMMSLSSTYITAKEVTVLMPGASVDIDADDIAFPKPLSEAPSGEYRVQAVLDVHHSYNYDGRTAGDLVSVPTNITVPFANSAAPTLTPAKAIPEPPDPRAETPEVSASTKPIDLISPVLTAFWGREIHMHGWVLLPPGYASHPDDHYPTVYFTHGFGGTLFGLRARYGPILYDRMKHGKMPEMIWVLLDESSPTGTHEFADGVNNGPWARLSSLN